MPFPYTFPFDFDNGFVDVLIDWNNDGDYADADEDVTERVLDRAGISLARGKDQIRALAPPMAGSIDFELDNQSRDYSPENASSPLYGLLDGSPNIKIESTLDDVVYPLAVGFVNDMPQYPDLTKRVGVKGLGSLAKLKGVKISTALYQDIRIDTALGHLLDAAGWPAGKRVINAAATTLAWWWLGNEDAFDAAVALFNTEGPGASLYEDGQGWIVFEGRYYRILTTRCNTSQATLSDSGIEPVISDPFGYNPGRRNVVNECSVSVNVRAQDAALSAVWSYGERLTLGPSEALGIPVSASDPFTGALDPVGGTDYTVISGSVASATLNRDSGSYATLTVTAGASGVQLDGLQVRAYSVPVSYGRRVKNTIDTTASQDKYGLRSYPLSVRSELPALVAQDFCNAIVAWYQLPLPTVEVTLNSGHADRLTQILTREISDRVTVQESQTGIDADCWIEQIKQYIGEADRLHVATFGCSKIPQIDYALWGSGIFGTSVWGW